MDYKFEQLNLLKSNLDMAIIGKYLPESYFDDFKKQSSKAYRERVFGLRTVLLGMIYQALSDDKSEQNVVIYIAEYHKALRDAAEQKEKEMERLHSEMKVKQRGRPKKAFVKIQKSKINDISLNTAAYDEARQRLPLELLAGLFGKIKPDINQAPLWHGHKVFIADGSSVQTVDTPELRAFCHPAASKNPPPLPILRIEGIIDLYGGCLVDFCIDHYNSSEGQMLRKLHHSIPENSILLADDLYSGFGHMAFFQLNNKHIIAQGKHKRKDEIVMQLAENDVIVRWNSYQRPPWYLEEDVLPDSIQVRRISYADPNNPDKEAYLYTTLMDEKKYKTTDILALYLCRWDIELGFREIKSVLKMEYLRSKTVEMVKKEVYSYLILYNIVRIVMLEAQSKNNADFFSLREKLQKSTSTDKAKGSYVDKLGRSYTRHSPGRPGKAISQV